MVKYGLWWAIALLTASSASGQEVRENPTQQTILLCDQIEDGALKVACEAFHQALLEKKLVSPPGQSAYDKYMELAQADPLPGLILSLRIKLTGALRREIGDVLDLAARLPLDQTAVALIYGRDLSEYQAMAEKLSALSESEGDGDVASQWRQYYFSGLALREPSRLRQSQDTALLTPALEAQMEALNRGGNDIPQLHQEVGSLLLALGRYNQSRNFFLHANKLAPDWAAPLIDLSQYLARFKEKEAALKLADQAVGLQTDFALTYLNAARLYARFNEPAKSIEYYGLALDKIMRDIASGPVEYRYYSALNLSALLVQFELYEQAEFFLKKTLVRKETPEAYALLGEVYELTNRTLSADSIYRRCITLWPEYVKAYQRGGALYQGLGRYALAEPFLEKAYELNPADREVCFNLGAIRHLYDRPEEAEFLYRQSLTHPAGMANALGFVDSMARRIEGGGRGSQEIAANLVAAYMEPSTFFKANLSFSGSALSAYEDFIYANLGDLYYDQKRPKEAIPMYECALLLNPGQGEVYKRLIQACYDAGDHKRAMTYIQLYQIYVPYSRDTREDWKTMGRLTKELTQRKIDRRSDEVLNVYTFFMENLWNYLATLNPSEKGLNLDRTLVLRQQRSILQTLKKYGLEEILK